jgi:hypothetical protein
VPYRAQRADEQPSLLLLATEHVSFRSHGVFSSAEGVREVVGTASSAVDPQDDCTVHLCLARISDGPLQAWKVSPIHVY